MKTTIPFTLRGAAFLLTASLASSLPAQPAETTMPSGSATTSTSTTSAPMASDNSKLAHHDKSFVEKAAKCGNKEVAVSQAVMNRVTNPQVRDFANMMVNDHTAANRELMTLAMAKGVSLPASNEDAKLAEKWTEKGGDLDKKYVKEMIEDHEDAVKLFEKGAKSTDAEIAAFAQKTLPTLMHHLSMAKDLKKAL